MVLSAMSERREADEIKSSSLVFLVLIFVFHATGGAPF